VSYQTIIKVAKIAKVYHFSFANFRCKNTQILGYENGVKK
jgi:hypothetical protein